MAIKITQMITNSFAIIRLAASTGGVLFLSQYQHKEFLKEQLDFHSFNFVFVQSVDSQVWIAICGQPRVDSRVWTANARFIYRIDI